MLMSANVFWHFDFVTHAPLCFILPLYKSKPSPFPALKGLINQEKFEYFLVINDYLLFNSLTAGIFTVFGLIRVLSESRVLHKGAWFPSGFSSGLYKKMTDISFIMAIKVVFEHNKILNYLKKHLLKIS